ncbi:MAG TPA: outer membrane protein transport protein, partial [Bacteroidia bacterium]|nr:outer membrane protein transport protein [Bacteroidia bacterium]
VIPAAGELQRRTWISKGSTGEFALTFGGNYSHRFYIGGTLGISSLRYVEQSTYEEIDDNNSIPGFKSFRLNNDLTTTGTGINFKLGMIYRANDFVRIGLAIHTPTFYDMRDEWSGTMSSEFDSGSSHSFDSPSGSFDYELTTPMKAIAGIGFIIGKMGIISFDYEFVDYSEAKFHSASEPYIELNNEIHRRYAEAGNLKIGTEWRYDAYSFRAGYAMYGTPFASGQSVSGADQSRTAYSAGIGIRDQEYFLDLAYVFATGKFYDKPYSLKPPRDNEAAGATTEIRTHNITLTFGVKF